jgi:GrpB-like predicted nucleotidyltransferase (UPF0157 family)
MVSLRRRNRNRTTPGPIRAAARPEFAREDACSRFALRKRAFGVEHIGPTSVPALAAKHLHIRIVIDEEPMPWLPKVQHVRGVTRSEIHAASSSQWATTEGCRWCDDHYRVVR